MQPANRGSAAELLRRADQGTRKPKPTRPLPQGEDESLFTQRELEVLLLAAEGKKSREIADALFVSKRTVDFHLAGIFQKLGVTNRMTACLRAKALGLLDMPARQDGRGRRADK